MTKLILPAALCALLLWRWYEQGRAERTVARRRHPHRPTSQTEGTGTAFDIDWAPRGRRAA